MECKAAEEKHTHCLRDSNGHIPSDPVKMCRAAVDFYSAHYATDISSELF